MVTSMESKERAIPLCNDTDFDGLWLINVNIRTWLCSSYGCTMACRRGAMAGYVLLSTGRYSMLPRGNGSMVQVSVQTGRETGLVWRVCCYRGPVLRLCWPGRLPGPGHLQRGPRQRRVRRPVRPEARGDGAGPGVGAAVQWEIRSGGQTVKARGGVKVGSVR